MARPRVPVMQITDLLSGSWNAALYSRNDVPVMAFLKQQVFYLAVAAIMAGVFWAIGQSINPGTIVLYSLCLGNLIMPSMGWVRRRFSGRAFPYNWLIFIAALLLVTPIAYVISSAVVVWIAPPSPQTFEHLVRTGWKFPSLTVVVYGVISRLHADTKERLEQRNAELQKSVAVSSAQLELQEQELERAREIQQSLLPKDIPQIPGFDVAAAWQPARMVGGDYFDVLRLSDNRLAVCTADVSGKGVSAALLMANVQATVRAFARETESPARVCSRVNSVLCGNIATGKFVSFFYGVLDWSTAPWSTATQATQVRSWSPMTPSGSCRRRVRSSAYFRPGSTKTRESS